MGSKGYDRSKRLFRPLALGLLAASCAGFSQPASAAGGMDPSYREVQAEPERALGRGVDWKVRLELVEKRFYTYTLRARYVPRPGEGPCHGCTLTVTFRGRPTETARPSRFKAGQLVRVRGTVIRLKPQVSLIAAVVD